MHELVKIKRASIKAGLSPDTLRRYERLGWIRPQRDWAGARLYSATQIKLLIQIRRGEVDPRTMAELNGDAVTRLVAAGRPTSVEAERPTCGRASIPELQVTKQLQDEKRSGGCP